MSKELISIGIPASLTESINMGKVFFESGLFMDLKSAAQAVVKIQAGAELGIPAFASLSGIHIIQGKPTIGAGIIASKVKSSGKYDYKVIQQDDKACSIDFYQGKEKIGNSTFTIQDAQKAGTKNLDKFPKNMLFARAISNGVKWFTPDIFAGPVYTPEEMEQVTEDTNHEIVPPKPLPGITMKAYKEALDRVCKGDDIIDKMKAAFTLTEVQLTELSNFKTWYDTIQQCDEKELMELASFPDHAKELAINMRLKGMFDAKSKSLNVPA